MTRFARQEEGAAGCARRALWLGGLPGWEGLCRGTEPGLLGGEVVIKHHIKLN